MRLLSTFTLLFVAMAASAQPDRSFTCSEYVKKGFPDPAKVWTQKDLVNAISFIVDLGYKQPNALPKLNSAKSGVCFKKVVSNCTLTSAVSVTNLNSKAAKLTQFSQRVLAMYDRPDADRAYYGPEIVALTDLLLNNAHFQLMGYDDYVKRYPKLPDQQSYTVTMQKHAYHAVILDIINDLSDTKAFKPAELDHLSAVLKKSLELDGKYLAHSAQNNIRIDLMRMTAAGNISATEKKNLNDAQIALNRIH